MTRALPVVDGVAHNVSQPMPPLYARWLIEAGFDRMPEEEHATCDECPMCVEATISRPETLGIGFDPGVKCCSYVPTIPNFLAGMILADRSPEMAHGALSLRSRLEDYSTVTPVGVTMNASTKVLYDLGGAFGRAREFRCPHYVDAGGGSCSIWRYRNSGCSTWFCKHVRGKQGKRAWDRIRHWFEAIETELSVACALQVAEAVGIELDLTDAERAPTRDTVARALVPADAKRHMRRVWGSWSDRVEEFYILCADIVEPMSWPDIVAICGARVRAKERDARQAVSDLAIQAIPDRLILAQHSASRAENDSVRVVTYSPYDPIILGKELLSALLYFDGRTETNVVLKEVVAKEGIEIDDATLRSMIDHGLLLPTGDEAGQARIL